MISRRATELATAALTGAFGAAVVVSSLDNGISWSTDGGGAGTFPFITGLLILGGRLVNLAFRWAEERSILLDATRLVRLARLFVPAAVCVAALPLIGMYVSSGLSVWTAGPVPRLRPRSRLPATSPGLAVRGPRAVRRQPDGPRGAADRGPRDRFQLRGVRGAARRRGHHMRGLMGRSGGAGIRPGRILRGLSSGVRELRRHGRRAGVQDLGVAGDRLRHRCDRDRYRVRQRSADHGHRRAGEGRQLRRRRQWPG